MCLLMSIQVVADAKCNKKKHMIKKQRTCIE